MKSLILILQFLTLLALVACGRERAHEDSDVSIIGGEAVQIGEMSLVRLTQRGQGFCMGVLVSPDLVLSAAHCLNQASQSDLRVLFPKAPTGDQERSVRELQKVREDSLLFFPNFDLGWLKLDRAAPSSYQVAKVMADTTKAPLGSEMKILGLSNDSRCDKAGDPCLAAELPVRLKSLWSSPHLVHLAVAESQRQNQASGTCPGDSGGPMFYQQNGETILVGIVAGKDPIFTSSSPSACGSPLTVLTRIGEYRTWIESTASQTLSLSGSPAGRVWPDLHFLTHEGADSERSGWSRWFQEPTALQSSWATVHKLLEQVVLQFQDELKPEDIPILFQTGGQAYIERLTALRSLTMGFPEQTLPLYDLRPLEAVRNLEELTFLVRPYGGLETIARLPKLSTLALVGRSGNRVGIQALPDWQALSSPTVTTLRLSQMGNAHINGLDLERFPQLRTVQISAPQNSVASSWLHGMPQIESLQVQEFNCDQAAWPEQELPRLRSLVLRTTGALNAQAVACLDWSKLPALQELRMDGYNVPADQLPEDFRP